MRIDDNTLAINLLRLEEAVAHTPQPDGRGPSFEATPGKWLRAADLALALRDLQTRRKQDNWVRQQMGASPQD